MDLYVLALTVAIVLVLSKCFSYESFIPLTLEQQEQTALNKKLYDQFKDDRNSEVSLIESRNRQTLRTYLDKISKESEYVSKEKALATKKPQVPFNKILQTFIPSSEIPVSETVGVTDRVDFVIRAVLNYFQRGNVSRDVYMKVLYNAGNTSSNLSHYKTFTLLKQLGEKIKYNDILQNIT